MLFNWIHEKYKMMLRLEVAEFLVTQEKSIYFSTDSYQLSTEMKGYLNDLIQKIRGLNNASIGLLGHTDGIGNSDYNLLLSARRTQAVKAYLLKNGINSNQIKTEHFGELKPIESNSSSKGRQKNRKTRCDFYHRCRFRVH